jgi:hypothetical protein
VKPPRDDSHGLNPRQNASPGVPLQLVALRLAEERTDRFGRVRKARIVFIHLHLRDDRDRFLLPRAARRLLSACWIR